MSNAEDTSALLSFKFDQLTTELESACATTRGLRAEIRSMESDGAPEEEVKKAELEHQRCIIDYLHAVKKMIAAENRLKLEKQRRDILSEHKSLSPGVVVL